MLDVVHVAAVLLDLVVEAQLVGQHVRLVLAVQMTSAMVLPDSWLALSPLW